MGFYEDEYPIYTNKADAHPELGSLVTPEEVNDLVAVFREAKAKTTDNTVLTEENERLRETLGLFRALVLKNATTWIIGSNHHHPIWSIVAAELPVFQEPTSGERWHLLMPADYRNSSQGGTHSHDS